MSHAKLAPSSFLSRARRIPPGDAAALAAALRRAVSDTALRDGAVALNRAMVQRHATWNTNMAGVEALFVGLGRK